MKRTFKTFSSLLLVLAVVLSFSAAAFAADASVTFEGMTHGFVFEPGSGYTNTDLFESLKDVMPGDQLTETIEIKNNAADCNYIKVYMRAEVHDEAANSLTYNETFENTDGKDQADISGERDETVATMADFLSQLTLRIYNENELIYEAAPDEAGALAENVFLGTLYSGESAALTVELDVPLEMGNHYANRVGEVDWVFLAEAFDYEQFTVHKVWDDNNYPNRPDSVTVHLLRNDEIYDEIELSEENQWTYTWDKLDEMYSWSVVEADLPDGYEVSYEVDGNTTWITNQMDYVPILAPKPVDLTVKKVWSGDENNLKDRPDAVSVTLCNGKTAVEKVILSQENNWTYSWEALDGNGDWSVIETGIPKGYTPSYQTSGEIVTITNTATLIQTGQLRWPIPVFGSLGVLMMSFGAFILLKKRKNEHA